MPQQPYWNPADKDPDVVLASSDRAASVTGTGNVGAVRSTVSLSSGKWYVEFDLIPSGGANAAGGVGTSSMDLALRPGTDANSWAILGTGQLRHNATTTAYGDNVGAPCRMAVDIDNGLIWFGEPSGVWFNGGDPATGTNPAFSGLPGGLFIVFGAASSAGTKSSTLRLLADYAEATPTGFVAGWGSTTTNQSLTATISLSASIRREIAKGLSAPITATASIVKTVSKGMSATCSLTAAIAKAFPVHLSASLTASASITKTIAKSLVVSLGLTATMQRVKTAIVHLSASVSLTASLATIRVFQQALSASITLTASMTKTISKRLVATQSMIARPIRWVATLLAATRGDKPNWNQCARCSRKVRPNKLLQQMEYRGPRLVWTGLYVCSSCIDEPQPQGIWPRETGGDPKPVILARPRRD